MTPKLPVGKLLSMEIVLLPTGSLLPIAFFCSMISLQMVGIQYSVNADRSAGGTVASELLSTHGDAVVLERVLSGRRDVRITCPALGLLNSSDSKLMRRDVKNTDMSVEYAEPSPLAGQTKFNDDMVGFRQQQNLEKAEVLSWQRSKNRRRRGLASIDGFVKNNNDTVLVTKQKEPHVGQKSSDHFVNIYSIEWWYHNTDNNLTEGHLIGRYCATDNSSCKMSEGVSSSRGPSTQSFADPASNQIVILDNKGDAGVLFIRHMDRHVIGRYFCVVELFNSVKRNQLGTGSTFVLRDQASPDTTGKARRPIARTALIQLRLELPWFDGPGSLFYGSLLSALAFSAAFIFLSIVWVLVRDAAIRRISHLEQTSRVRAMLTAIENYRARRMENLHETYNRRVSTIRENYHAQMDQLRQSYTAQTTRVREEWGGVVGHMGHHLEQLRDNYNQQVNRLREFGSRRAEQIWDGYDRSVQGIRAFTAQQRDRISSKYRLKQRYINKLLEAIDSSKSADIIRHKEAALRAILDELAPPAPPQQTDTNNNQSLDSEPASPEPGGGQQKNPLPLRLQQPSTSAASAPGPSIATTTTTASIASFGVGGASSAATSKQSQGIQHKLQPQRRFLFAELVLGPVGAGGFTGYDCSKCANAWNASCSGDGRMGNKSNTGLFCSCSSNQSASQTQQPIAYAAQYGAIRVDEVASPCYSGGAFSPNGSGHFSMLQNTTNSTGPEDSRAAYRARDCAHGLVPERGHAHPRFKILDHGSRSQIGTSAIREASGTGTTTVEFAHQQLDSEDVETAAPDTKYPSPSTTTMFSRTAKTGGHHSRSLSLPFKSHPQLD